MSTNDDLLSAFDTAAQEEQAKKPTLASIFALVADKFNNDTAFEVYQDAANGLHIGSKKDGKSIQVSDNKDGTFCVNSNGQEMFNQTPAEQTLAALGRFYGRYATPKP